MRVSVRKDDPGYVLDHTNYKAYLNGKELKHCFTADEEKGLAYCFKVDSEGKVMMNKKGTAAEEMVLKGGVQIKLILNE